MVYNTNPWFRPILEGSDHSKCSYYNGQEHYGLHSGRMTLTGIQNPPNSSIHRIHTYCTTATNKWFQSIFYQNKLIKQNYRWMLKYCIWLHYNKHTQKLSNMLIVIVKKNTTICPIFFQENNCNFFYYHKWYKQKSFICIK